MFDASLLQVARRQPLRRFWRSARHFWHGPTARLAWGLIAALVVITVLQLVVQYRLNVWNRDFFNALEFRNGAEIWHQTHLLALFAAVSIGLAVTAVWGRMTFQRAWREWVSRHLIDSWLEDGRYLHIELGNGEHQNTEYRITEDARLATDAPIDLVVGLLSSVLTAGTFVVVLGHVGGALDVSLLGTDFTIPGYLVVAAMAYALLTTGTLMIVGRHMIGVIESKNQAEAELKYAVAHLRERATRRMSPGDLEGATSEVGSALGDVVREWRRLAGQYMRTTYVSHGNTLLAPLVGLILCVPHYVQGTMLLGDVTQAAAAFVAVQGAFNWLIDNFPRLAECLSSANRVGNLLLAFDRLESADEEPDLSADRKRVATS
ncbi:SbmA/BacA-like family transporter [Reyranella sp.]|uniref:SbmA/BacA-like family transporter n=1 Tax=Reyranella sp. TaxID=1929291 RepID=UPI003F70B017